jgi:hypothetical protein
VVPEQKNQTQADAARGGSKGAASGGSKQQEQSSRYEMETGDSGTRDGREQSAADGSFAVQ